MYSPKTTELHWDNYFRIIPSKFPPINFFENIVPPDQMEEVYHIESLTNDRLREERFDISLVRKEDRISGPGASIIMAAFTHINEQGSRFSDGSFGVYYAAQTIKTAVKETIFHREKFLSATLEKPGNIDMRLYTGKVLKPLHDIRNIEYQHLHDPNNYSVSQSFGAAMQSSNSFGIVYNSVRNEGSECIAALRPPTVSIPIQSKHLVYEWDGTKIKRVYEKSTLFEFGTHSTEMDYL